MAVRLGVNPIGWSNDDMLELGGDIPLETCLAQASAAGFEGIELGNKFPRRAAELRPVLDAHGIDLIGGWYSTNLLERSVSNEIAATQDHLALLRDMGCGVYIIAETTGAVHGKRGTGLSDSPMLASDQWPEFASRMTDFCKYLRDQGFKPAYHHHMGTVVETADEIARFMDATGDDVGLLLDSGHATFTGAGPAALAKAYGPRITHLHCKDVRRSVLDAVLARDASFLDAVIDGAFTVPGDGDVDFAALLAEMSSQGYAGWAVVEAEQDPEKADPKTYAALGRANLACLAGDAGLL
jgi:inosose dehydratase